MNRKVSIIIAFIISVSAACDPCKEECEDLTEVSISKFPLDFFKVGPYFEIINDTLMVEAVLSQKNWHQIFSASISFKINHLMDSLQCFDIQTRLSEGKVKYYLYQENRTVDNLAEFSISDTNALGRWESDHFRALNDLIISSDPNTWHVSDLIMDQFLEHTSNQIYDITMAEIYNHIILNNRLTSQDTVVLRDVIERAKLNPDYIDFRVLERFLDLAPAEKELIIEDQIPDHLKEKNE